MLDKSTFTISKMFNSMASRYDLMNDLITLFGHRLTRKFALKLINFSDSQNGLDLATGTGDFAILLKKKGGKGVNVTGVDISKEMLSLAKYKTEKVGESIDYMEADIQELPFEENSFDVCTIGYGIRNVPDARQVMKEVLRVTKPGGHFVIVEITPAVNLIFNKLSFFYYKNIVPIMARLFSPNKEAYNYLFNSISNFPTASRFAKDIQEAGWNDVTYYKQFLENVTIFSATKLPQK